MQSLLVASRSIKDAGCLCVSSGLDAVDAQRDTVVGQEQGDHTVI